MSQKNSKIMKEVSFYFVTGKLIKWFFIVFNLLMLSWSVYTQNMLSAELANGRDDAYLRDVAFGGAIIVYIIYAYWLVGNGVLAFFALVRLLIMGVISWKKRKLDCPPHTSAK